MILQKKLKDFFSGRGKPLGIILSLIPALAAAALALYYVWGPAEGYFHSDCTDNLLWADVSVDTGKVFDETFKYAGMLPFSATIWMIPLVRIFGVSMTAQNIGMSLFALIYICSVIYFCRSADFGWLPSSLAAFASICAMSASDKLREIMYGHNIYYSIGPVILFFGLGMLLRMQKKTGGEGKKNKILFAVLCAAFFLLSAATATDGGQVIVLGTLPAIAAILALKIFSREKLADKKGLSAAIACVLFVGGTLVGLALLSKWKGEIDCGYANAYSGWSDVSTWADNAKAFVKQYFTLLGVSPKGNLFSKESIGPMIRILGGLIMIFVPIVCFFFYRKLSDGTKALLWGHTVVTAAVMFGFICGKLSGANWRLTPILGSASVVCIGAVRELFIPRVPEGKQVKRTDGKEAKRNPVPVRAGALLVAFIILFSLAVSVEIIKMPADYGRDNNRHQLAAFLEEHGLEYGYATFWQSQAITAISGSKVKCREILCDKTKGVWSDHYQSSTRWYSGLDYDEYFVLLSDSEYATVSGSASWQQWIAESLIREYTPEDGLYKGFRVFVFKVNVLE